MALLQSASSPLFLDKNPLRPWESHTAPLMVPKLNYLAVRSLISLFDERQGLFGRGIPAPVRGLYRREIDARGSMIALLGLLRLGESGATIDLDTMAIRNAILRDTVRIRTVADLGLLTWVTALSDSDRLPQLFSEFDFDEVLDTWGDARARNTRALAWFLSGIAHAQAARSHATIDLTDAAVKTYHLLLANQGEHGIFKHSGAARSLRDIASRRFGTFGDQMHAIYALTAFARAFETDEPLDPALMCANCVCDLQGDGGQWWFLYDTRRGRVAGRYPVRSTHQDGIGPAALLALEEVTGQSFRAAVWHGLSWLWDNELGMDLRGSDQISFSDAVDRRAISRYWETLRSFLGIPQNGAPKDLRIRREVCADHFGWLLYAFGSFGLPQTDLPTLDDCNLHAENAHNNN